MFAVVYSAGSRSVTSRTLGTAHGQERNHCSRPLPCLTSTVPAGGSRTWRQTLQRLENPGLPVLPTLELDSTLELPRHPATSATAGGQDAY